MGCSPDAYCMTPADIAEEARQLRARKLIRLVPLSLLTVADLLAIHGVFDPSYPMHTWSSRDTDVLVAILEKLGRWA
jgi:hypothetical protein